MPAQTPQTVPNVSSYMLTVDSGGGGRVIGSDDPDVAFERGCEAGARALPVLSCCSYDYQVELWAYARNSIAGCSHRT